VVDRGFDNDIKRISLNVVNALDIGPRKTLVGIMQFAGRNNAKYIIALNF